ncbi:MAG TPA: glycosyltransferase family 39 protein [Chloroflexia bacterium]|nr:glycosyltransferase family 39 protein [Chloroflexia bacterium]
MASVVGLAVLIVATQMLPGLYAPVDAPVGVESTYGAQVNVLRGISPAAGEPRLLPPTPPWVGAAPVDSASGFPIYTVATVLLGNLVGDGDTAGRTISILFSLMAGLCLFSLVHRTAGARAAVYAGLLYGITPLSVMLGRQFSPASTIVASQALCLLLLVCWRSSVSANRPGGSKLWFSLALVTAFVCGLLDPAAFLLAVPATLLFLKSMEQVGRAAPTRRWRSPAARAGFTGLASRPSPGLYAVLAALAGGSVIWRLFVAGGTGQMSMSPGDSAGGITGVVGSFLSASTYTQVTGLLIGNVLSIIGLFFLVVGVLHGARAPFQLLFTAWMGAGLLHTFGDAARVGRHDEALLPLLLPACALVGIGAAWSASFPSRIWLAVTERKSEPDADYTISPHTSWLLNLPEERRPDRTPSRPQAQISLRKNLAQRSRLAAVRARRTGWAIAGHLAVFACFGLIAWTGWPSLYSRLVPSVESLELRAAGIEVAGATPADAQVVVAGPNAPEIFYSSRRTGWALTRDEFNLGEVQALQRRGAQYLLSTDQEWLGKQPDYVGLLANYSVAKLSRRYILFDLSTKPAASDRLYFLESGHTLGGEFRHFWEANGGVQKLGYPISEEYEEASPLDGKVRVVQYFERAVLEQHPEFAGSADSLMLAATGRWVTQGRDFPRITPFKNSQDRAYFSETGHSVKESFLRFWLSQGGLALFGYPISEELPEISPADGKVYTVQYFERARFEWHPTEAGTNKEVQLGLIGKQALEMRK